jgi:hypothetical protein
MSFPVLSVEVLGASDLFVPDRLTLWRLIRQRSQVELVPKHSLHGLVAGSAEKKRPAACFLDAFGGVRFAHAAQPAR